MWSYASDPLITHALDRKELCHVQTDALQDARTAYLVVKGYRILTRQYRAQGGELDIVAVSPPWTRRTLVFVEVRARATVADAADSIGAEKRRRVESARWRV